MARLGDLVLPVTSRAPAETDGAFRYVDLSTVDASTKSLTEPKLLDWSDAPSRARQRLAGGDVLVATVRPNLNGVAVVPHDLEGAIGSTGFCVLRADPAQLDNRYLFHWVRSTPFVAAMTRLATGASYPAVSDATVKSSEIPLPPLLEQRRIASILDEVQVATRLRRQAIDLIALGIDSLFFDMTPSDAIPVPLGSVLKLSSGRFLPTKAMAGSGTVAVYGGNGVSGRHDEAMYDSRQIVVGRVGAYCGVVHVTEEKSWVTDNAMVVSWREVDFELDYLAAALKNANLNQFASQSGQPLISAARLEGAVLRMPARAVQREYVARLRSLHKIQTLHERHLAKLGELFESLQHRAFSGQL